MADRDTAATKERSNSPSEEYEPAQADVEQISPRRPQPFTHNWSDPEIAVQRATYVKAMVFMTVVTMFAILALLSVYWGAFWKTPAHIHNLSVHVVDLDGADIGQALRQLFTSPQVTGASSQLTYTFANAGDFSSAADVAQYVDDENAWAGIVVSQSATSTLRTAIAARDVAYNSSNAITVYITTSRNENAVPRLVTPQLTAILEKFSQTFAATLAQNLSSTQGFDLAATVRSNPALLTRPVGYHYEDLRPFDVPVAAAVDFVGLIYLLVIAFLMAMMNYNIRLLTGLNELLNLRALLIMRLAVPFIIYFALSWVYSFISLAFQVPFSRHYGHGGFVLYWILSFLGMSALGLAVEALITILGPKFIPYFLLLWIIINVSVAFFPISVLPGIYRYGYAMPFYNVGQAVRTIVFGTKNHLGTNYGILLGWAAISIVLMPLFTILMRRKEVADATRKKAAQDGNGTTKS